MGQVETVFRQFRNLAHIGMMVPLYAFGCALIGISATPGALMWYWAFQISSDWALVWRTLWLSGMGAWGYISYGFCMILVVPLANFLMRTRLHAWRGPYYSLATIPWYIHNGSTYLVRYTFLEFITPTPFNLMFYRLMGMKIGRGTVINSSHISDPSLIELGEKVTIGGSVTMVGHYGVGGFLILAPIKVGDRATIGLRAIVFGGVDIGAGAKVLPNSVVLPKTVIPAGETWGGVPAKRIEEAPKTRSTKAA